MSYQPPQVNPQQSSPLMTALQSLSKFYGQNRNPSDPQSQVQSQVQPQQTQPSGNGGALSQYLQKTINPDTANLPWKNQGIGGLIDGAGSSLMSTGMNALSSLAAMFA